MNPSHLETFVDYYAAVSDALTRPKAIMDFNKVRDWFGHHQFDKVLAGRNSQEVCIIIDTLLFHFNEGSLKPDEVLSDLVLNGAKSRYAYSTLEKFNKWVEPKEIEQPAKRPSFGNVVMFNK
jgi:hypothetical protein